MKSGTRSVVRLVGSTLLLACICAAPRQQAVTPAMRALPDANGAAASAAPEVRLRKLHLVRPDLIPYPLAYEVYC